MLPGLFQNGISEGLFMLRRRTAASRPKKRECNEPEGDWRASAQAEPLSLSAGEMASILRQSHVSDRHIDAFTRAAEEEYGDEEAFHPANLVGKKFEIVTPDVKISTSTEFSASIETRTFSGRNYLMIPVEDEVVVNGIRVKLTGQETSG